MNKYNHTNIEQKWRAQWEKENLYDTDMNSDKPKAFVLDMFPYPSGEGLHVGHPKGYIATDVYSRFKKMSGYEVLHPMGWDAFGLPAENYALKHKVPPRVAVDKNIANFKAQLEKLGFNYDWNHEINTTDPEYYKWTQWIFLQLFKKGLAFESHEPINWCPSCQTGLANEDLESDGTCERCDSVVEKRPMRQWVLRITDYADRLLDDLSLLEKWPEHIKESQRNWIGKSEGALIKFSISNSQFSNNDENAIEVFTTRPDTIFGATYMVLAPEHPLVAEVLETLPNKDAVRAYVHTAARANEMDRLDATKEKTGVVLEGVHAINPANSEEIPVYIADYVLAHYGTGAIMAVPAHDERDHAFAEKFQLPIIPVVSPIHDEQTLPYANYGKLIDSGEFTGMDSEEAKEAITKSVGGTMTSTYRLNDWVFSRQRYWGEPIPIVHCKKCGAVAVPEDQLPVVLPEVEHYEPTGTGESPLANIDEWVNTTCPECNGPGKRETNTMPQWAGSSWYYLRFLDPKNSERFADPTLEKKWLPVDVYVGGDHAVRHLIYARFWHKVLFDLKLVSTPEPFSRLEFLGFILAEDGRKMSKRWGNVINPDDIVAQNGADALRVYEMFMSPFENTTAWSTDGLVGAQRFIERVWRLHDQLVETTSEETTRELHKTIKKVGEDIEHFKFNTAIAQMMVCVNTAYEHGMTREQYTTFVQLLAPFAPHVCEELWRDVLQNETSVHSTEWPAYDKALLVESHITIAVQVNGKLKGEVEAPVNATQDEILALVATHERLAQYVADPPKKVIVVPNKLVSLVL